MTAQQHTVLLGDGSTVRFSSPERAAAFAVMRRQGIIIDAAARALSAGCVLLAIMIQVMR